MRTHFHKVAAAMFLCAGGTLPAGAGTETLPTAHAAFTANAPVIDGVVEDRVWAAAERIPFPLTGDAKSTSDVRFLWNAEGVYVAFQDLETSPVFGHFSKGAMLYEEDVFEVFLDQAGDHKQYFEIQVNPAGQVYMRNFVLTAAPRVTKEGRLTPEFTNSEFWRWDWPVPDHLRVASQIDRETGRWTLEMFLPASLVNHRQSGIPLKAGEMRLNLVRHNWDLPPGDPGRKGAFHYWAPVPQGCPHISPTLMGGLILADPR